VPLWTALVVLAVGVIASLVLWRRLGARSSTADVLATERAEARQALRSIARERDQLAQRVARDSVYARALSDVVEHLEHNLRGSIEPTSLERIIEKGMLEPICSVFSQHHGAVVKMAVLGVQPGQPFEYRITYQANWGPSAEGFKWSQAEPLENIGFETREAVVARPIRRDADVGAMLIALAPSPFSAEDAEYISLLASVIAVVAAATEARG
jgi:hypothetical protein